MWERFRTDHVRPPTRSSGPHAFHPMRSADDEPPAGDTGHRRDQLSRFAMTCLMRV